MSQPHVLIVGAGPAGLFAAERLSAAGVRVTVAERMPSPARKFLMAGRGGLNLTHSEPPDAFRPRYAEAAPRVAGWLDRLPPADLIAWAEGLGQPVFTGSSGRVFPRAMKASPLLRAWLARLADRGVTLNGRWSWTGLEGRTATFDTPGGPRGETPDALLLAMGGASWPRLGADGGWRPLLEARSVAVAPFRPANAGVDVAWSPVFADRFAGQPLKGVALSHGGRTVRGEAMVARYGLEGGAVYALTADLRRALDRDGTTTLTVDLRPDLSIEALAARIARGKGKDSVSNQLRKAAGLSPVAVGLLREIPGDIPAGPDKLARRIKAVRLTLTGLQGLDRAISSAGGVGLDQVDDGLMLTALPGVFVAGEMLDWEAPTGGYLLQACFASGAVAADGVLAWLARDKGTA
ncbi:MAG: TIGR03862 family flavoprotein [Alphaproteobacteria bacterium]|nr:TIGR03862 family flavoprotein [Alphaproteobacteria bacterium]MBU1526480.1 TIGR03862 family flavoprotein [Alphaproteobacteria bacterium]MBU2116744.1 TIGR03862 family flavoprotein [Alphaproteobacteria bacterium]MBU2350302.1 TIGR03862 family flavoprotein [Alphaproteobacteria bacterium]MBU2382514.1 TIGR03862 family flavoprotein [Alphaproteobacteria bacterium]